MEALLGARVQLEVEQREVDGRRVVVHSRVKQCKKAVTPLEQERKLYLVRAPPPHPPPPPFSRPCQVPDPPTHTMQEKPPCHCLYLFSTGPR